MVRRRLILAAMAALAASGASAQVKVHDLPVQAIMAQDVNPAALAFWAGGNDPPDGETKAQAKIRWEAALKGAQTLQAKGRELMDHSRPGKWNDYAQMLVDGAVKGEGAAKAKDAAKAFEIGGDQIYGACAGCHYAYIPRQPRQIDPLPEVPK